MDKKFNCKHYIQAYHPVPMPFGEGTCEEKLGDCRIESESDDCTLNCSDYKESEV